MLRYRAIFVVSFLLLCAAPLPGLASPGSPANAFVSQDGYTAVNPDAAWQSVNEALAASSAPSALSPAANLGPMPLAIVGLDSNETALERVRYRLRYGVRWTQQPPAADPVPLSYIEVIRFNLGPAVRQELVQALGAENVADAAQFGLGAHVGWRFITQPLMGNRAVIVAAGRREFSDATAHKQSCFGAPCLATASNIDRAAPWSEPAPDETNDSRPALPEGMAPMSPAAAIQRLLGAIDSLETVETPDDGAHPEWLIEAAVERNLGQDDSLDAAYRLGGLMDDSVKAIWERSIAFPDGAGNVQYFSARADECARGPDFAPPGQFCP